MVDNLLMVVDIVLITDVGMKGVSEWKICLMWWQVNNERLKWVYLLNRTYYVPG